LFVLQGGEWDLEQAFGPGTRGEAVQAAEALMNATEGRPERARVTRAVTRASGLQEVTIFERLASDGTGGGAAAGGGAKALEGHRNGGTFGDQSTAGGGERVPRMSAGRRLVAGTRGRTLAVSISAIIALAGLFIARDCGAYEASAFVLFGVFLLVFTYPAHLVIERTLGIDPEVVEA
jgi:hypothetical protein